MKGKTESSRKSPRNNRKRFHEAAAKSTGSGWAKGTGYGFGQQTTSVDVKLAEETTQKRQSEEEHVISLFYLLACYLCPDDKTETDLTLKPLPKGIENAFKGSCVMGAVASYIKNDSGTKRNQ